MIMANVHVHGESIILFFGVSRNLDEAKAKVSLYLSVFR